MNKSSMAQLQAVFLPILMCAGLACFGAGMAPAQAQGLSAASAITEILVCTQLWDGDTNADMTGIYWDPFKAVFEPVGIKINVTFMPYKISIARVRAKTCDIAMSGYMNEYSDLLYPQWPQEIESVVALHASDMKFIDQLSFVGKKSAWLEGYGYDRYLPAEIDFIEVRSEVVGLWMLERGRIDYFVDYEDTTRKAALKTSFDLSKYSFSPVTELSQMVYPMFRHDDRGAILLELYNRRMSELHQDGTLDRIFEKYELGIYPAPSSD